MLRPLLAFCFALQRLEPLVPELLEERLDLDEALAPRAVEPARAVSPLAHEPDLLQDVQVLRDRRARHVEVRRDLAGGELAVADERQDLTPPRRRDRLQRGLHTAE